jgi:hypothetical protein
MTRQQPAIKQGAPPRPINLFNWKDVSAIYEQVHPSLKRKEYLCQIQR